MECLCLRIWFISERKCRYVCFLYNVLIFNNIEWSEFTHQIIYRPYHFVFISTPTQTTSCLPDGLFGGPTSLHILMFTLPEAIYPNNSLMCSTAKLRNSGSWISSVSICFSIWQEVSASISPLLNLFMQSTNFSMQLSEIWWK